MSIQTSVLAQLLSSLPNWRPQMYFKSSLTALSHAMEDRVLAGDEQPLVIASFQRERFYRQEAHRYRRIAQKSNQVYVLAAPETDFKHDSGVYEKIAFDPEDTLTNEWHLIVVAQEYATCLVCRERSQTLAKNNDAEMDTTRRFEGIWTFDPQVSKQAASIVLERILAYRPELAGKIKRAKKQYLQNLSESIEEENFSLADSPTSHPDPFVQRLVTYLQAGQYKLLKANRSLVAKEKKERLINSVTTALRRSLDPEEILQIAVEKLGEGLGVCRCIVYRCKDTDATAVITHEFINPQIDSLKGQTWLLQDNPLFAEVAKTKEAIGSENAQNDPRISDKPLPTERRRNTSLPKSLYSLVKSASIVSWLLVPVLYQGRLLGMVELHHCGTNLSKWTQEQIALVEAIATQVGVALIQAEAYANLEDLNEQLEALDRTRSNLVAITGHELRTPLSTIQVCLESLASEPDMSPELRQVMLNTALTDAERMRKLIQDFLTLSQLESGRVEWHPESISLEECIYLAVSNVRARLRETKLPEINVPPNSDLPLVQADGEWVVEVLAKLIDNACKFTDSDGEVTIQAKTNGSQMVEVTVSDTGRGIEPNRLETVFDRFYQEEGALRRTTGGTGLGLAICRQIVNRWGGEIWAESPGKDRGAKFRFTLPIVDSREEKKSSHGSTPNPSKGRKSKK
ncbi:DICT sensory domain-containing protein [Oscillatoria salina]|uniref:DICT sensory domain-containing protein n=1 Tax=Oscillatoria salina TaxID=331517 RepID=UPI0013BA64D0|nr:DICT sensory domain-containing protein [Oscillatoria salina]MBZ8181051.1 GAF domain-containing protein [Oscillatoria salina IIICB1]NET90426.1 GAF domain-containing protein [Kamptonema sp. SIO1D9]